MTRPNHDSPSFELVLCRILWTLFMVIVARLGIQLWHVLRP